MVANCLASPCSFYPQGAYVLYKAIEWKHELKGSLHVLPGMYKPLSQFSPTVVISLVKANSFELENEYAGPKHGLFFGEDRE